MLAVAGARPQPATPQPSTSAAGRLLDELRRRYKGAPIEVSIPELTAAIGAHRRTVIRAVKTLAEAGAIEVEATSGRTSRYRLTES
jgi:DNA-binding IclR family transcriptional regulator